MRQLSFDNQQTLNPNQLESCNNTQKDVTCNPFKHYTTKLSGKSIKKPNSDLSDTVQQVVDTLGFTEKDFKSVFRVCFLVQPSLTISEVYRLMAESREGKNPCALFYWKVKDRRAKIKKDG